MVLRMLMRNGLVAKGVLLVLLALGGLSSCRASPPTLVDSGAPLPAAPPVVEVIMRDHSFDYPQPIPPGRVVFRIQNDGQLQHRLALLPLAEDFPPVAEQVKGTERRPVDPFAGIYDRRPGGVGTFAVDLVAGQRYAMVCFTVDPDGVSHAVKGMTSEFRAGGGTTPGSA